MRGDQGSDARGALDRKVVIATWHDTSRIHPGATRLTLFDAKL